MSCLWLLQATESVNEAKKLDPSSINTLFMLFKLALAGSNIEQGLCTAYLMVHALLVGRKCFACTHWNLIFSDHSKGRPTEHVQWGSQAGEYRQGEWGSETDLSGRFYGLWGTSLSLLQKLLGLIGPDLLVHISFQSIYHLCGIFLLFFCPYLAKTSLADQFLVKECSVILNKVGFNTVFKLKVKVKAQFFASPFHPYVLIKYKWNTLRWSPFHYRL